MVGAVKLPKLPRWFIGPARDIRRPRFPVNRDLVSKQLRAAEVLPPNSIKPLRVEDQEDSFVRPVEVPEDWYPIG